MWHNKIKLLLLTLLLSMSGSALAWGWGKHDVYVCPSDAAARACNSLCKKDTSIQAEFKVNQQKNLVMPKYYVDGQLSSSPIYEDCKIIDDQNWACESKTTFTKTFLSMKSGQFDIRSFNISDNKVFDRERSYVCAKK